MHAFHFVVSVLGADTPFDYTAAAGSVSTVLGGLGAGLLLVISAALAIRAVRWGIPKIIGFFARVS